VDGKGWSSCGSDITMEKVKKKDQKERLMIRVVRFLLRSGISIGIIRK
jgi:hypothetical protein